MTNPKGNAINGSFIRKLKKHQLAPIILLAVSLVLFMGGCSSHKPVTTETPGPQGQEPPLEGQAVPAESLPPLTTHQELLLSEDPPPQGEAAVERTLDPQEALEEAMNAYQESLLAWDRGQLELALNSLDEAYSVILKIELSSDSPLLQEKNDLRLLIAQRIQEIYASQATAIGENHGSIPLVENKWVQAEIKSFTTGERKLFEDGYKRSGFYHDMILEELRKEGMPEELSWIPMIESWFKVRAYSRARALGLWQFIASTGYRYGLKRDRYIDERMDPEKATRAAVAYLKELHSWFGDWTTALAAYNCGEYRVRRVINAQRVEYMDNFWDLYQQLPRETARFVPRFIATLIIINDPRKYGMDLADRESLLRYETITVKKPVKLSTLSSQLGLDPETLADMNPELRYKSTPDSEYQLKVPVGHGEKALASVEKLSRYVPPEATYVIHYVRRGDTVSGIATRYRTSVSAIARMNNLGRRYLIRPGQRLRVPTRYGSSYAAAQSRNLSKEGDKLVYSVKRGDSLYLIARSFNTSIQRIKSQNNLRSDTLQVGQKLVIQSGTPEGATFYTVRRGDTPYKIAQKYGMNLSVLLNLNGLTTRSKIYPGQKLIVTESR